MKLAALLWFVVAIKLAPMTILLLSCNLPVVGMASASICSSSIVVAASLTIKAIVWHSSSSASALMLRLSQWQVAATIAVLASYHALTLMLMRPTNNSIVALPRIACSLAIVAMRLVLAPILLLKMLVRAVSGTTMIAHMLMACLGPTPAPADGRAAALTTAEECATQHPAA